ncbi:MAG: hypothetical protein LAT64_13945 [Phycisphaerales bacterium]|nr:hypothetical protein [Planctomycetota bacterium]MCH8509852.1 hypothetical protein [Phycisphaerales bacterium]
MKAMMYLAGAAMAAAPAMGATVYTDSASFLDNVLPGFYFNDFAGVPTGSQPSLNFSGNGFSYTVSATGPGSNNLFNNPGLISLDDANDSIVVTFTSGNVTAVGGNFWSTDINFQPRAAEVVIELSDGTVVSYNSTSAADFRGFTSNDIITSISITALNPLAGPAWATMDNLYVGQVIPAPGAMALLGLGGLAAARRRR